MKWRSFLRIKIITAVFILGLCTAGSVTAGDPVSAGTDIGSQVRKSWASEEGFKKITQALYTGNTTLKTLDGSQQGTARINCPGTLSLFEILVQPGPTGDLNFISVTYDVDFDGNFEKQYQIPGPVSGICANGFVKCDAGTWNNCHWYKWKFENEELSAEEVSPSDLGGCYCINTGCTQAGFLTFKDQVLRSLGGGVAGAMAAADPRLSVAEAKIDGIAIRYYAQNVGNCSLTQGTFSTYGFDKPEDLYQNAALLSTQAENEVLSQSADSDSFYTLLTGSPAFTNGERLTCQKVRNVYVSNCKLTEDIADSCSALENRSDCYLEEEKVYDVNGLSVTTYRNFNPTGVSPVDSCVTFNPADFANCVANCQGDITTDGGCSLCYPGQIQSVSYQGNGLWRVSLARTQTNSCGDVFNYQVCGEFEVSWDIPDDPTVTIKLDGTVVESVTIGHTDGTDPSKGSYQGDTGSEQKELYVSLNNEGACNGWANGSLIVYLKLNIPSAVCHDWWKIERTYVCTGTPTHDPDVSRADTIAETLTEGGGTWTYTDPITGTGSVDLNIETGETCIKACKLMLTEDRAQAGATTTTADYRTDPTSVTYIYRTCIDGTCPVNPGETIVKDCQCLNEFNEVYGAMESLRQATVDMICSDGTKK
ncbi:hypothetical protein Thein_1959 [Thermodesulfatator indicus DSM 15286]|uniref:Uncharacterized protein n=1 Tax=Thermodesulfatator indicus (strain DSM 15286 / JCM 11887 / CIR29812) TaxID=667014 RepID=F8ACN7_THEID|nr:hypothetical protein [Thermodesulfatator indicus]AEH45813.1 hypothetical protein Thein_1959 [Thermodesulfatator indicus DSM 15286]